MQNSTAGQQPPSNRRARSENDLLNLSAPVLELVLKLRAGVVAASEEVRPVVAGLLEQLEQTGPTLGYLERQVQDVKFALAAFVDETILTNDFPLRDEWEQYPLQLEYFNENQAGLEFFNRLERMLKNIEADADVVEVYYLCLLLGFKGKYFRAAQQKSVVESVAAQLRACNRLGAGSLSSHWLVTDQPVLQPRTGLPLWAKATALLALGTVLIVFLILYVMLQNELKVAP